MMTKAELNEMLQELRSRLVGKTILAIDPPRICEGICKITLTDGSAFKLCATDLGYWVEEVRKRNPGKKMMKKRCKVGETRK
jgi:hypothetical protein